MRIRTEQRIALGIILCTAIAVIGNAYPGTRPSELEGITGTQDVRSLDRRISSLEQRLYSIESNINRLQQSAITQRQPVTQPNDQEVNLLRDGIQRLQLRLNEIECGLVRLDERTTTDAARKARSSAKTTDPCRLNPGTPLRLSTRQ